ncbi:hypothetical protein OCU04_005597 [Sclerotinia nivalis]|uniref:YDG domain-containing protein n=1 Tax=Sclerotinia nivalis TaxID=352851 RepID=A0A9X0DK42_9HELO|nr:hypothetical protein OCU04_005597 [Sclerotinia nivalis]
MFRGIKFKKGQQPGYRATWVKDERSPHAEGHNGHVIGDWWPYRLCTMRDVVHGNLKNGICGKPDHGAVSILMGSENRYKDIDNGDVIEYCGDKTNLMDLGFETGKLIRVIRGAKDGSIFAPSVGFRYDGLYKIESKEKLPEKGYNRYKLVQDKNQKPIRMVHPTVDEMDEFIARNNWISSNKSKAKR